MDLTRCIFFIAIASFVLSTTAATWNFGTWPVLGPVTTEFIAYQPVDAPKHSAFNATAWDWWYFDVVSDDLQESICITFDLGVASAIIGGGFGNVPYVAAFPSWSDGFNGFNTYGAAEAIVTADSSQSSSGLWRGAGVGNGVTWNAPAGTSRYELIWDTPEIQGMLSFVSKAPPHYPCGAITPGSNLEIFPGVGWANAVPDADAVVDLTINGRKLSFSGVGYHDKNWGLKYFPTGFNEWYWGHARFGPYSIVWFSVGRKDGGESVSLYLTKDGAVVAASCEPGSIVTRPIGVPHPPPDNLSWPSGFTITANLGELGQLNVVIEATKPIFEVPFYYRWIGTATGSVGNGPTYSGIGLWEEINPFNIVS